MSRTRQTPGKRDTSLNESQMSSDVSVMSQSCDSLNTTPVKNVDYLNMQNKKLNNSIAGDEALILTLNSNNDTSNLGQVLKPDVVESAEQSPNYWNGNGHTS